MVGRRPVSAHRLALLTTPRFAHRTTLERSRRRPAALGSIRSYAVRSWWLIAAWLAAQGYGAGAAPAAAARRDERVVRDRLWAPNDPRSEDDSFLSGVGAIWPAALPATAARLRASTGFLIDRCHVLTSQHAISTTDFGADSGAAARVAFGVGQTRLGTDAGALLGFAFVLEGTVIATGSAAIVDPRVIEPARDWALIRLTTAVADAIAPLEIRAVEADLNAVPRTLATAGYPADHRHLRPMRLGLKDLWGSDGVVVDVLKDESGAALLGTTLQATRGQSGGPVYGTVAGRPHVTLGMVEGIVGNGLDAAAAAPNIELLFTAPTLAQIEAARSRYPCP